MAIRCYWVNIPNNIYSPCRELLGSKDLGAIVFKTLMCNVGKL